MIDKLLGELYWDELEEHYLSFFKFMEIKKWPVTQTNKEEEYVISGKKAAAVASFMDMVVFSSPITSRISQERIKFHYFQGSKQTVDQVLYSAQDLLPFLKSDLVLLKKILMKQSGNCLYFVNGEWVIKPVTHMISVDGKDWPLSKYTDFLNLYKDEKNLEKIWGNYEQLY